MTSRVTSLVDRAYSATSKAVMHTKRLIICHTQTAQYHIAIAAGSGITIKHLPGRICTLSNGSGDHIHVQSSPERCVAEQCP